MAEIAQHVVPRHELPVGVSCRVTGTADAHSLQHPGIPQLLHDLLGVKFVGEKFVIGLEATYIVRGRGIDASSQILELLGEFGTNGLLGHRTDTAFRAFGPYKALSKQAERQKKAQKHS